MTAVLLNVTATNPTKSSFLTHVIDLLLREARRQAAASPGDPARLRVVPIILNVKNFDLFHIDRPSRRYDPASSRLPSQCRVSRLSIAL